jgi:protein involved in polysaccharide export with SLBB domain
MLKYCEIRKKYSVFFSLALTFLGVSLFQGCYSSTAVKGVPVRDLVMARDQRVVKPRTTREEREAIIRMSESHGNGTFTEISGIPEYLIGPMDVLEIISHVGDEPTSTTVTVNSRGRISYSFLDDLDVNGMAPSQLDELITKEMSAFVKKPRIDIIVKEFNSKSVTVLGEVASLRRTTATDVASGRFYLEGKTNVMDLIAMAGGYTVNADIKNVTLIRDGKKYRINLYDILEKGDETCNVILDTGDVVDVPELSSFGERVYVMGAVNAQGIYPLRDASDVLGAISVAGSITPLAKEENTLIVRGYKENPDNPLVMMSDVRALLRKADLRQNIDLQDGDLVYVPRMLVGDLNDWITNTKPMLDFLLYPQDLTDDYFTRDYLHLDSR